jgi:hypothetical protein
MKEKIKYICELTDKEFNTKKEAEKYETEYREKEFRKLFPLCNEKDDEYKKHCIFCGLKVLEYDCVYDGHRNERGDIIFEDEWNKIFGSVFCLKCYNVLLKRIKNIIIQNKEKFNFIKNI